MIIVIREVITMMRGKYKKYTAVDKENYVKEYLRLKSEFGITKIKFASDNEIPLTSFKRWVKQYLDFMNESSDNTTAAPENAIAPFIMISDDEEDHFLTVPSQEKSADRKEIKLRYKDVVIEFQPEQLQEVMEILRLW